MSVLRDLWRGVVLLFALVALGVLLVLTLLAAPVLWLHDRAERRKGRRFNPEPMR